MPQDVARIVIVIVCTRGHVWTPSIVIVIAIACMRGRSVSFLWTNIRTIRIIALMPRVNASSYCYS